MCFNWCGEKNIIGPKFHYLSVFCSIVAPPPSFHEGGSVATQLQMGQTRHSLPRTQTETPRRFPRCLLPKKAHETFEQINNPLHPLPWTNSHFWGFEDPIFCGFFDWLKFFWILNWFWILGSGMHAEGGNHRKAAAWLRRVPHPGLVGVVSGSPPRREPNRTWRSRGGPAAGRGRLTLRKNIGKTIKCRGIQKYLTGAVTHWLVF